MCKIMAKWEVAIYFVVLGAHVRVLTPINVCHFNGNFT